ncbi:hypothetical protein FRC09_009962 [Ceratobasidium sp. 395]|nr:hypothetical protein FRC09_009962 [Ceratobasidium sp. 395]
MFITARDTGVRPSTDESDYPALGTVVGWILIGISSPIALGLLIWGLVKVCRAVWFWDRLGTEYLVCDPDRHFPAPFGYFWFSLPGLVAFKQQTPEGGMSVVWYRRSKVKLIKIPMFSPPPITSPPTPPAVLPLTPPGLPPLPVGLPPPPPPRLPSPPPRRLPPPSPLPRRPPPPPPPSPLERQVEAIELLTFTFPSPFPPPQAHPYDIATQDGDVAALYVASNRSSLIIDPDLLDSKSAHSKSSHSSDETIKQGDITDETVKKGDITDEV